MEPSSGSVVVSRQKNVERAVQIDHLLECRYRFNPAYQIIASEELSAQDRQRIGITTVDPEMPYILVPAASGLSVKAVCANTADLLTSLRRPGSLSPETRKELSESGTTLVRLVLDSVLEVKTGDGFVSGAEASKLVDLAPPGRTEETRNAQLSIEALHYAQALECGHAPALSARMYFYNRIPASPLWTNRIASMDDFTRFVGLENGSATRMVLDRAWTPLAPSPQNPGWLSWRLRGHPRTPSPYKLYLSPACDDLRETLLLGLNVTTELGLPAFKLGRGLHGILRPDKIVIYVPTLEDLRVASRALLSMVRGRRAHGVPFTAGIDHEGLVSWGMDPPRGQQLSTWQGTSWRRWITDRLAVALLAGKNGALNATLQPWEFALSRLAVEGVNTATWVPETIEWMQPDDEGN
jgi:hypothetical protein